MAARPDEEHEGASVQEQLIEACRRNNTDLLSEIIHGCKDDDEVAHLLNDTTTVLGNHLYHEAALRGNYEVIDLLLDQPNFECDPLSRADRDTPLHSAIRWLNSEPPAQRAFGNALVEMMLEAGSSTRVRNRAGLTPLQLVDPRNEPLRELLRQHEYELLNRGDFVVADGADFAGGSGGGAMAAPRGEAPPPPPPKGPGQVPLQQQQQRGGQQADDDAEFSGSDEEERAEWERRRRARRGR